MDARTNHAGEGDQVPHRLYKNKTTLRGGICNEKIFSISNGHGIGH